MITAFDHENIRLEKFKVSVRNHCHKDRVVLPTIFKLAICDMIKKRRRAAL